MKIDSKLEMGDTQTVKNRYDEDLVTFLFSIVGRKVDSNVDLLTLLGLDAIRVCSQAQPANSSSKLNFTVGL